jgi:cell division control protein 45
VGGLVDLAAILGLEAEDEGQDALGGVELWVFDARRPWNLGNVFGGRPLDQALGEVNGNARAKAAEVEFGQIRPNYKRGRGGIIVYDDGDVGELEAERQAYFKLEGLPPIDDDGQESDESEAESESDEPDVSGGSNKRKAWSDADEDSDDDGRARQRRRANSVCVENPCVGWV